ncbi:MAG: transcriptional repressor [Deltaproteobacteria bacterium]|nr:transcriptional repressor [Deltaproteobacteria bacterium]
MAEEEKIFKRLLKERGMRYTKERRSILKAVMSCGKHFEAESLVRALRSEGKKVSIASVYRTIPLLIDAGIVIKNPCDQMNARMETIFGHQHHDHLICINCKKVIEFRDDNIEKLQARVAEKHGFQMKGHRLLISGYCSDCDTSRNQEIEKS